MVRNRGGEFPAGLSSRVSEGNLGEKFNVLHPTVRIGDCWGY